MYSTKSIGPVRVSLVRLQGVVAQRRPHIYNLGIRYAYTTTWSAIRTEDGIIDDASVRTSCTTSPSSPPRKKQDMKMQERQKAITFKRPPERGLTAQGAPPAYRPGILCRVPNVGPVERRCLEDQHRYDAAPLGFVVQPVVQDPQRGRGWRSVRISSRFHEANRQVWLKVFLIWMLCPAQTRMLSLSLVRHSCSFLPGHAR